LSSFSDGMAVIWVAMPEAYADRQARTRPSHEDGPVY
jgi:hypothetical protein